MSLQVAKTLVRDTTDGRLTFTLETIAGAAYTTSLGTMNSGSTNSVRFRSYGQDAFDQNTDSNGTVTATAGTGITDDGAGNYTLDLAQCTYTANGSVTNPIVQDGSRVLRWCVFTVLDRSGLAFKPTQIIVRIVAEGEVPAASGANPGAAVTRTLLLQGELE
jgi:hypothetical protein